MSVTKEGIANAVQLMEKGWLNRYQSEEMDYLLQCERAFAEYIGVRWAIGLNSGASAIFLALKCGAVPMDAPVLTNAFTFNAVPSSIVHAGCKPILVECTDIYTIDLDDLCRKIEGSGSKVLVLSYMRGRIPDIDAVLQIVEKYGLYLIEDAAHAYGCEWKGRRIGSFGESACVSTQANKLMNSGEGGFLLTNNDDVMARAIISAGCYEEYFLKHKDLSPPRDLMMKYRTECVNYSMRMTNLQGAILLPQISVLNERRGILNRNYYKLVAMLSTHPKIHVPPQLEDVTPVYDSLQFMVKGLSEEKLREMTAHVKKLGCKLGVFGFMENARNYRTWGFIDDVANGAMSLPDTDEIIACSLDTRLDLGMTDERMLAIVDAITKGVDAVFGMVHNDAAYVAVAVAEKEKGAGRVAD
jgi:dTDP-4-amino-4,6-dideoxygalactose transaminase